MRLINADKVVDEFVKVVPYTIESETEKAYDSGLNLGYFIVQHAPTVEAIPIERLEQEIKRYLDLGLTSVAIELRIFVDEWRKEND